MKKKFVIKFLKVKEEMKKKVKTIGTKQINKKRFKEKIYFRKTTLVTKYQKSVEFPRLFERCSLLITIQMNQRSSILFKIFSKSQKQLPENQAIHIFGEVFQEEPIGEIALLGNCEHPPWV